MAVEYRSILNFPGYRVGDDGSVWSRWRKKGLGRGRGARTVLSAAWRLLKPQRMNAYGHVQVGLHPGHVLRLVHRLVLETFVGPCPEGMECRHLDGNPANNRLENLCWGTPTENVADARRHGTIARGERHGSVVLTEVQVRAIRAAYAAGGKTMKQLGKEHGVSPMTICRIMRRENWGWLP